MGDNVSNPGVRRRHAVEKLSARRAAIYLSLIVVWAILPFISDRSTLNLLAASSIYTIVALGVALLLGYCGIVSLAQGAFFGVGAFASAYLTVQTDWPIATGFIVGILVSGAVAFALGAAVLRLEGYYLALATLALGIIATIVFGQWESITGGSLGVGGMPPIELFGIDFSEPRSFYYFGWLIALLCILLAHGLVSSYSGLAMRALRDHPAAAEVLGVDIARLRLKVFIFSACLGSLGGSLYAHFTSYVSPTNFGVDKALLIVLMAVLGGSRRPWGTALGAIFVTVLPSWLSDFGDFHQVIFGIIMVAVIVFLPTGIAGLVKMRPSGEVDCSGK